MYPVSLPSTGQQLARAESTSVRAKHALDKYEQRLYYIRLLARPQGRQPQNPAINDHQMSDSLKKHLRGLRAIPESVLMSAPRL